MTIDIKRVLSSDRNKVLLGNIGGTVIIRGFSVIVSLFATPAYLEYFHDNAILGLWYTLVAALNWILTFDFGVGNGLRNKLAIAIAKKDLIKAKQLVSTAYVSFGALVAAAIAIGLPIASSVDWAEMLNYSGGVVDADVLYISVSLVFVGTMLQFLLKLITSVLFALQKTALNNLLFLIGNVILLAYLLIAQPQNAADALIGLSVVQVFAVNLPLLVGTIYFFCGRGSGFKPSPKFWDRHAVQDVIGLGSAFFIVQIALLFINSSNEYLITMLYDSSDVVDYQVYYKCFYLIVTIFTLAVQPIWSAMTVAIVKERFIWVRKVYRLFNIGAICATVFAVILAFAFPAIVTIWLQDNAIDTPISVSLTFAGLVCITLFVNSSTCVANASNRLNTQMLMSVIGAGLKIGLSLVLANAGFPWECIVQANCIALIPLLVCQTTSNQRYFIKHISRNSNE